MSRVQLCKPLLPVKAKRGKTVTELELLLFLAHFWGYIVGGGSLLFWFGFHGLQYNCQAINTLYVALRND